MQPPVAAASVLQGERMKLSDKVPQQVAALIDSCWQDESGRRPQMSHVVETISTIVGDGYVAAFSAQTVADDNDQGHHYVGLYDTNATNGQYTSQIAPIEGGEDGHYEDVAALVVVDDNDDDAPPPPPFDPPGL